MDRLQAGRDVARREPWAGLRPHQLQVLHSVRWHRRVAGGRSIEGIQHRGSSTVADGMDRQPDIAAPRPAAMTRPAPRSTGVGSPSGPAVRRCTARTARPCVSRARRRRRPWPSRCAPSRFRRTASPLRSPSAAASAIAPAGRLTVSRSRPPAVAQREQRRCAITEHGERSLAAVRRRSRPHRRPRSCPALPGPPPSRPRRAPAPRPPQPLRDGSTRSVAVSRRTPVSSPFAIALQPPTGRIGRRRRSRPARRSAAGEAQAECAVVAVDQRRPAAGGAVQRRRRSTAARASSCQPRPRSQASAGSRSAPARSSARQLRRSRRHRPAGPRAARAPCRPGAGGSRAARARPPDRRTSIRVASGRAASSTASRVPPLTTRPSAMPIASAVTKPSASATITTWPITTVPARGGLIGPPSSGAQCGQSPWSGATVRCAAGPRGPPAASG